MTISQLISELNEVRREIAAYEDNLKTKKDLYFKQKLTKNQFRDINRSLSSLKDKEIWLSTQIFLIEHDYSGS